MVQPFPAVHFVSIIIDEKQDVAKTMWENHRRLYPDLKARDDRLESAASASVMCWMSIMRLPISKGISSQHCRSGGLAIGRYGKRESYYRIVARRPRLERHPAR